MTITTVFHLLYSASAVGLFVWLVVRWRRIT